MATEKDAIVNYKVRKLKGHEINLYYETLLKNMLKAVKDNDYLKLGSLEETLRKSIIITIDTTNNFNYLYLSIMNKVLLEELSNYINVSELDSFKNLNLTPNMLTVEEANTITNARAYKKYERQLKKRIIQKKTVTTKNNMLSIASDIAGVTFNLENVEYDYYFYNDNNFYILFDLLEKAKITEISTKELANINEFLAYLENPNPIKWVNFEDLQKKNRCCTIEELLELEVNPDKYINWDNCNYAKYNEDFVILCDIDSVNIIDRVNKNCYHTLLEEETEIFLFIFFDYVLGVKPILDYEIEELEKGYTY